MAFSLTGELNLRLARGTVAAVRNELDRALSGEASARLGGLSTGFQNLNRSAQAAGGGVRQFATAIGAGVTAAHLLSRATGELSRAIHDAAQAGLAFDRSMTKIGQLAGATRSEMSGLSREIRSVASQYGVAGREIEEAAAQMASAGLSLKDVQASLKPLAQARLGPGFESMKEITESAIVSMRTFKREARDLPQVLGAIGAVSSFTASEASGLATALQKAGGAWKAAGGDLEGLLGTFASIKSATRQADEEIAVGLKTLSLRLARPETTTYFKQLGIDLRDANGQMLGVVDAVDKISERLSSLPTGSREYSGIIEQLGGVQQAGRAIPLLSEASEARRITAMARQGSLVLDVQTGQALDSLGSRMDRVTESWRNLGREFSENASLRRFAEGLEKAASGATDLVRALAPLAPILGAAGLGYLGGKTAGAGLGLIGEALGVRVSAYQSQYQSTEVLKNKRDLFSDSLLARGYSADYLAGLSPAERKRAVYARNPHPRDVEHILRTTEAYSDYRDKAAKSEAELADLKAQRREARLNVARGVAALGVVAASQSGTQTGDVIAGTLGGGLAGSVAGPWGAAIGAVVGFTSSLRDATQAAESLKRATALTADLTQLEQRLQDYRAGGSAGGINEIIARSRQTLITEAAARSQRTFAGIEFGLSPEKYRAEYDNQLRTQLGPKAALAIEALTAAADRIGRENRGTEPSLLEKTFRSQNSAALGLIAELRQEPLDKTSAGFVDLIKKSQRAAQIGQARLVSGQEVAASNGQFGRFARSYSDAAINPSRTSTLLGGGLVGLDSEQYLQSLHQSGPFAGRLAALKSLREALPAAIAEVAKGDPLDGADFGEKVRARALNALGKNASPEVLQGLNSAISELGGRDIKEVLKAAGDPSKLTDSLLELFGSTGEESAKQLAELYKKQSDKLAEGFNHAIARIQELRQGTDRLDDLRLDVRRSEAALRQQAQGGGDPLLGLDELLAPWRAKMARFLQGTRLEEIGDRLGELQDQIQSVTTARDSGQLDPLAAADRLKDLVQESDRLKEALRKLADPTEKLAAIQERLAQVQNSNDSKLGFAEKFFLADGRGRAEMARGQLLLGQLKQNPAAFASLPDSQKRIAIQGARDLGQGRFADGTTGLGLLRQFLLSTGVVPAGDVQEEGKLLADKAAAGKTAVGAQETLNQLVENTTEKLTTGLRQEHTDFLTKLSTLLKANAIADARVGLGTARGDLAKYQELAGQRDRIAALGLPTDLKTLTGLRPLLSDYSAGAADLARLDARRTALAGRDVAGLVDQAGGLTFNQRIGDASHRLTDASQDRLTQLLLGPQYGFDAQRAQRVVEQSSATFSELVGSRGLDERSTDSEMVQRTRQAFNDAVNAAIKQSFLSETSASQQKQAALGQRIRGIAPGARLDGFNDDALKFVDGILAAGTSLENLDQRIRDATTAIQKWTESLKGLGVTDVEHKAAGGFISRGTDTVPAMLSPGEYVVNAKSASANPSLLEHINGARGPVYLADGGPVSERFFQATRAGARRAARYGYYDKNDVDAITAKVLLRKEAKRQIANRQQEQLFAAAGFDIAAQGVYATGEVNREDFGRKFGSFIANSFAERAERRRQSLMAQAEQHRAMRERYKYGSPRWGGYTGRAPDVYAQGWSPYWTPTEAGKSYARDHAKGAELSVPGRQDYLDRQDRQRLIDEARRRENLSLFQQEKARTDAARARLDDQDRARLGLPTFGTLAEQRQKAWARKFADGGEVARQGGNALQRNIWWMTEKAQQVGDWMGFADGGFISGGVPGRDSVPALLMPGEFVLRKRAVQAIGADQLHRANRMADGGPVGSVPGGNGAFVMPDGLVEAMKSFAQPAQNLSSALNLFGSNVDKLVGVLEKFPTHVEFQHGPMDLTVTHNGAEVFATLNESMKSTIEAQIRAAIDAAFKSRLPDAGQPVQSDPRGI